ncbi:peptidylprolyl isomerase [Sphingomonas koreensis]|nr:peptidylprolyl isomerase [Sphingomonas koreensis]
MTLSKAVRVTRSVGLVAALALGTAGFAQSGADQSDDSDRAGAPSAGADTGLNIPSDVQLFGKLDPNVRKPTAIINGTVITGTDVDQRVALIESANNINMQGEDLNRLKLQVLRGLIDETLEIQEAKSNDVTVTPEEILQGFTRVAQNFKMSPDQLRAYLVKIGSSERSLDGQIEAELAWSHYLRKEVEPFVNVGDEEVAAILDRLKASQGTEEYHLKEIYMSASPDRAQQVHDNMQNLMKQIQSGEHPFEYFAQFSEASTRAVGGDLSWVRAATLPGPLAEAAKQMQVGQIAGPIEVPGGFSLLYLVDKRQVGTADPRDARLSLRQLTITFPAGTTQAQATARAAEFAKATQAIQGCGGVAKVATQIGAEVVDNDQVTVRQLPPQLQDIMLKLQVGQATPPFGSATEGVRALVLCGRDDAPGGSLPGADQVQGQLEQQRVNLRAEHMLRDLRRDAVVEYR